MQIDFGYDYAGRRTSVITGTGVSRQTEYDINGKVTSVTDGVGNKTYYELDEWGRVSAIHKASGYQENWTYHCNGLPAYADCNGRRYEYDFDCMGRLKRKSSSGRTLIGYDYDLNGNKVAMSDYSGKRISYRRG